ncbi:hypothetical protein [Paraburkholderia azotifigens]|uniref:Uncharacterized protein n=1 Tax=Paraburkholderia azotifigens TaxID=2057004 RepID=A0ABU9R5V4_9BURK
MTRKGFRIVPDPQAAGRRRQRLDQIFKHPAVLVAMGFLLSGVLGGWLTHRLDQQQRERESSVKSMDDLRASIDDLNAAFSDYIDRANKLVDLRESEAAASEIAVARADYQSAYYKWDQRLSVDAPNIRQRYPATADDPGVWPITVSLQMGTGFVSDCLEHGVLLKRPQTIRGSVMKIVCKDTTAKVEITVRERLLAMALCVGLFTTEMRPDPKDDLIDTRLYDPFRRAVTEQVKKNCDTQRLMGLVDAAGNLRR